MIARVFLTGKGFAETCAYLQREQGQSRVVAAEGVRTHDYRLMVEDFEWQHQLMPGKEKPVFHAVLSHPPGERPEDALLARIPPDFLQQIGVVNTQYAAVLHTDKEHLHMHIIANRVNNDGEPTGKGLIIERSIKAAKELTLKYGLQVEQGKQLGRTHLEALHEPDAKRYRIYAAIREQLPECRSLEDLEERLQLQGITVRYRHDPATEQVQGISFRLDNRSFKGSRVDAEFSLKGLEKTLVMQQRRSQEEMLRQSLTASLERLAQGRLSGWDEQASLRRRQELASSLARVEKERLASKEERVAQELQHEQQVSQEQRQVRRRGLRH